MNEFAQWLDDNDRYLAAGLGWIRERLSVLADECARSSSTALIAAPRPAPQPPRRRSWFGRSAGSEPVSPALDVEPRQSEPRPSRRTFPPRPDSMATAESAGHPPALMILSQRLGLTEFERHTLLLCAAMELDSGFGIRCARAQQDTARPYPTFALALALFDQPAWDLLSPERPLRYWRLLEITQAGAQPLVTSALKVDERIVCYLKGLNYFDDRMTLIASPVPMPSVASAAVALPPSQANLADAIVAQVAQMKANPAWPAWHLVGRDEPSRVQIAQRAAATLGLTLYRMNAEALPANASEVETLVRLWQRETALLPIALYLDASRLDHAATPQIAAVQRLTMRCSGLVFIGTRDPWPELSRERLSLDVRKPTPAEQQAAWHAALGPLDDQQSRRLAAQFNFATQTISTIALRERAATEQPPEGNGQADLAALLWAACVRESRMSLDHLAQPLVPKATWDDLELAATEKQLLREIADQVRSRTAVYDDWGFRDRMNRGFGISVLFTGESGTGKTMAAEVIAQDLDLPLYRIDLSGVVSKYIGETEKNLRTLFDAAEDGGAILFFDEADALFGKRSEVKDSHDRYANIEINYLLQRMETYRGLAVLATNMKTALDGAFMRRLRFVVHFPFPGPEERTAIWRRVFPARTPIGTLDWTRLARLNLTGGSIQNIALNAAFRAAQAGSPVTMPVVLQAARAEFMKLERPINEADFRWLDTAERLA